MKTVACWMLTFVALALVGGCEASKLPEAYNVEVRLADSLRDESGSYPSVDIFLKGISDWERKQDWSNRSNVDHYTPYRGTEDTGSERVLRLGAGEAREKTLSATDPCWNVWANRGATYLVIVANYPRSKPPGGETDRRLLLIPLDRKEYLNNNLQIDVAENGLDLRTPPRPLKP